MRFGIIKSKIEKVLLESYSKNTFKEEIKKFNSLVLENKNISKIFYLYDELSSNKGLTESVAKDYINESIKIYENTLNKIKESDFNKINEWVNNIKTNNEYENIDNIFNINILNLESNIKSKNIIVESLTKTEKKPKEVLNIPLKSMINIANKTFANYVESLNEVEQKEFKSLIQESDNSLSLKYDLIKESLIEKLNELKSTENDESVITKIDETIEKVNSEKYSKINYVRLKSLKENL
jgi:hypothetical protein